jgi:hypothetical protein
MADVSGEVSFGEVFGGFLERAYALSNEAQSFMDSLLPDGMTFATMPEASVQKLHLSATAAYRAGLACLQFAETSVGAFSLLRGVLEAWSHIAFIADSAEGGDARCRALRYERGALKARQQHWWRAEHAILGYECADIDEVILDLPEQLAPVHPIVWPKRPRHWHEILARQLLHHLAQIVHQVRVRLRRKVISMSRLVQAEIPEYL